jgi:hypothetical protein
MLFVLPANKCEAILKLIINRPPFVFAALLQ